MITYATKLVDRGYAVFPVCPGKKIPMTTNGFLDASRDVSKLKEWFGGRPKNIGIATGNASKLAVIDLDMYKPEGPTNMAQLIDQLGFLPLTYTVRTPRGGSHLYFNLPPGIELRSYNNVLAKGVDVRANGGYILSEGSWIDDPAGQYTVMDDRPLADLPKTWVAAWLALNEPKPTKKIKASQGNLL